MENIVKEFESFLERQMEHCEKLFDVLKVEQQALSKVDSFAEIESCTQEKELLLTGIQGLNFTFEEKLKKHNIEFNDTGIQKVLEECSSSAKEKLLKSWNKFKDTLEELQNQTLTNAKIAKTSHQQLTRVLNALIENEGNLYTSEAKTYQSNTPNLTNTKA